MRRGGTRAKATETTYLTAVVAIVLAVVATPHAEADSVEFFVRPLIAAGDPGGVPPDTPADRVDPNTTTSPFAGVGGIEVDLTTSTVNASGVLLSRQHVLTAAHTFDRDNDGIRDVDTDDVTFFLNFGSDLSHSIGVDSIELHPDFDGFASGVAPLTRDDIAVMTLSSLVPDGVPTYEIYPDPVTLTTRITMVGYGDSEVGTPAGGFFVSADPAVKRSGDNIIDDLRLDDENPGSGIHEVFVYDFDGPGAKNFLGGSTLGNDIESTAMPGDSGGPAFVDVGGQFQVAGLNTFAMRFFDDDLLEFGPDNPQFGSGAGGVLVGPAQDFIFSIVPLPSAVWAGLLMLGALAVIRVAKTQRQQRKPAPLAITDASAPFSRRHP